MTERFYDGVFIDASRTNQATGRSFHIPAPQSRVAFWIVTAVQFAAVAGVVALAWAVLS